jgi:sodium transport system permease protein
MNFRDVVVVLRKELRETLRDRRTLAVMVLFPLVVYPLISLVLAQVIASKQTADDARASRVAVVMVGEGHARAVLADADSPVLASVRANLGAKDNHIELTGAATMADVAAGRVDALVEIMGPPPREMAPQRVRVLYDETHEPSDRAHSRIAAALGTVLPRGCTLTYAIVPANIAEKNKVGGYVLSKILPLIVIVMTMLGAFYPAIDITAGERERGTLETLLSSPVRRFDLMTGKVLAVAVLATLTGVLNIFSLSLTVTEAARFAGAAQALTIPWTRAAATVLTVIPAAFFFGALMVAIGAMARSFKEAQNLMTPVYLLCLTPSLVATVADFRLSGLMLLVPGTNLTLLARDLMLAEATIGHALFVLCSTVLYGALALSFAARLYDSERLLASTDGEPLGIAGWIRQLLGRERVAAVDVATPPDSSPVTSPEHAIGLFAIAFVASFFVFTWLQRWRVIPGLMLSQWLGFFGLVWIYARLVRRRLGQVIGLRRPSPWALVGATLLGLSGWVILGVLADRLMPPPPQLVEAMRRLIRPPSGDRPLVISLVALALTPAICEEALFRGPILLGLRRRFSMPAACVLTGLLFGIMHGDLWRFLPTFLLGALLSWVALASGSIVPSMVVHFFNNGALTLLGYYGLDQASEKLPASVEFSMLGGAAVLFFLGIFAVRHRPVRGPGQGNETS